MFPHPGLAPAPRRPALPRAVVRCDALEARVAPAADFTTLPVVPDISGDLAARLREVLARGAALGNRADTFIKVGDSNTWLPGAIRPLGEFGYNITLPQVGGQYTTLATTLGYFRGHSVDHTNANSFTRASTSALPGWTVTEARPAARAEAEFLKPGFALVMIGTNDLALNGDLPYFKRELAGLVDDLLQRGTIPILSTVPPLNLPAGESVDEYNQAIADLAEEKAVPLLNLWRALQSLPNDGLSGDNVHLSAFGGGAGVFTTTGLLNGFNVRNLTFLLTLDQLKKAVIDGGTAGGAGGDLGGTNPTPVQPPSSVSRFFSNGPIAPAASAPAPVPAGVTDQRAVWRPLTADRPVLVSAAGPGGGPRVDVFDAASGGRLFSFFAFNPFFSGGVHVTTADLNADGFTDVVAGAGAGGGPSVVVFSGRDGSVMTSFFAYNPFFSGGVTVAAGDVDGDGDDDLVTGAGPGAGPHVKVFLTTPIGPFESAGFFAYPAVLTSGVNVAAGDTDGDGKAEIITAPAVGPPHVKVFTAGGAELQGFYGFNPLVAGASVAAGDADGDGRDEIVLGAGLGGSPVVRVVDARTLADEGAAVPFSTTFLGGVRVAVGSGPGGGQVLYAGSGPGALVGVVRRLDLSTLEFLPDDQLVLDAGLLGVDLGAS